MKKNRYLNRTSLLHNIIGNGHDVFLAPSYILINRHGLHATLRGTASKFLSRIPSNI